MKVAITGSTGLVGNALGKALRARGNDVVQLVRREPRGEDELAWDPSSGVAEPQRLSECDAVVHLAGENLAARRWSAAQKARIRDSRIQGTRRLVEALGSRADGPRTFLCASAVGFYGDTGDRDVDESAPAGTGFLADLCAAWEAETAPLAENGLRVAHLRFGVVLNPGGGALKKMLLPFRLGLGGRLGSGRQGMSWITLEDAVGATLHVLDSTVLNGPVNIVAPTPATNASFTRALGSTLHRPTWFPMPAFAARLAFGELADEALLASTRALPKVLAEHGYVFGDPKLEAALQRML